MLLLGNISVDDLGEELLISYVADAVVTEYTADGRSMSWPQGVDPQFAAAEVDYPSDVWAEASRRWQAMSPETKTLFGEETAATVTAMMAQNTAGVWRANFAMMDLLWFGLAAWTAFKIGAGASGSEE